MNTVRIAVVGAGNWGRNHVRTLASMADVELVAYELADAGRQIRLYSKSLLPRAREALTLTRTAYRTGKRSLLDVIESERALLAFETSYWRACRDYVQGQARMKAIVGGEIK